ncbi:homogentisate 1,2-dioxygenase [Duganella sp. BJB1802]|uniref:homogentisate 1,2-dioxygenase n=1 Tax=Duganella sp. BJB1802 TaxID=2744575 RepID=UPI001593312A|nr:homogentisate 1,2-dioxygenase [Duganella sp. BJB1802]NVD69602.1 homogentisate 1,2-dioxygenase [Duganella sp. BJB1802]
MSVDTTAGVPQLWTREGFNGPVSVVTRRSYAPDFLAVEGGHVPRRSVLESLVPRDQADAAALPTVVATSKIGVRLLTSARSAPMPFTVRNVEADELHFIQSGQVRFDTDVGSLVADEGDFVCIPRSVAYRYAPTKGAMRSVILECPSALSLTPPGPLGMINFGRDVQPAKIDAEIAPGGPTKLLLKTADGEVTTYLVPHDPLALGLQLSSSVPVWKLNLQKIQSLTYEPHGGPPSMFLSSRDGEALLFNLSSRSGGRAPAHVNADFDEVILYVRGPGAYGACTEPGTLTLVPKGVIHHGPIESVPEGYQAWLLETRATLRFTPEAIEASELMETGSYGRHPSIVA